VYAEKITPGKVLPLKGKTVDSPMVKPGLVHQWPSHRLGPDLPSRPTGLRLASCLGKTYILNYSK